MRGGVRRSIDLWRVALIAVAPPLACGPSAPLNTPPSPDTSTGTTALDTTTMPPPATTDDTADHDTTGDGIAFVDDPDFGSNVITDCSVLAQDCPAGLKCSPWANDGGGTWYDTRCSPIAEDPGKPGDPCTVEDGPTSGIDDCELGAMCFDVDPETNVGTCFAHCVGSQDYATCEDPDALCLQSGDEVLYLCYATCNPLAQDCGRGEGCYPVSNHWMCMSEAPDAGTAGAPCEYIESCMAGLICLAPAAVPGCTSETGCCSEICDLDAPSCTGALEHQTCQPWYERGNAYPGLENVGVCALPP